MEAVAKNGDDDELEDARDEFAEGLDDLAEGDFASVIEHFKNAWQHAEDALRG
jgi:hypothetical protein